MGSTSVGRRLAAALIGTSIAVGNVPPVLAATAVLRPALQVVPEAADSAMATDPSGKLHVAFTKAAGSGLWYASNASGTWAVVRISTQPAVEPDIAADGTGKLHIVFNVPGGDAPGVRYATNRFGAWRTTRLTGVGGDRPSIAVDPLGEVHISTGGSNLKYLTNRRGYWIARDLGYIGTPDTSIAIDSGRYVHIAYGAIDGVYYVANVTGQWVTTKVKNGGIEPSIAVHGSSPRIAYQQTAAGGTDALYYLVKGSTGWTNQAIRYGLQGFADPDLQLDSGGKAHVLYTGIGAPAGQTDQIVEYATNASGSWVATPIGHGIDPSVGIGVSGAKHFAYRAEGLYIRSSTTANWSAGAVTGTSFEGDIVFGSDGVPRIAYGITSADPGIRVGYWTGSSWSVARVTQGVDRSPDIALDAQGRIHVAFVRVGPPDVLWHGVKTNGVWAFTKLDTSEDIGCPAVAVAPGGIAHVVAYREHFDAGFTYHQMGYYTNATGPWTGETIAGEGCPDIAVDGAGKAHVVYGPAHGFAAYRTNATGTWVSTTLPDNNAYPGRIAITPAGQVAFTYTRDQSLAGPNGMLIRIGSGTAFAKTMVSPTADPYQPHGLAVDGSGRFHILFAGHDAATGLHYATNETGAWVIARLTYFQALDPAVAVRSDGLVFGTFILPGPIGVLPRGLNYLRE